MSIDKAHHVAGIVERRDILLWFVPRIRKKRWHFRSEDRARRRFYSDHPGSLEARRVRISVPVCITAFVYRSQSPSRRSSLFQTESQTAPRQYPLTFRPSVVTLGCIHKSYPLLPSPSRMPLLLIERLSKRGCRQSRTHQRSARRIVNNGAVAIAHVFRNICMVASPLAVSKMIAPSNVPFS